MRSITIGAVDINAITTIGGYIMVPPGNKIISQLKAIDHNITGLVEPDDGSVVNILFGGIGDIILKLRRITCSIAHDYNRRAGAARAVDGKSAGIPLVAFQ